jgi:Putative prokaryotic signal transducing protein
MGTIPLAQAPNRAFAEMICGVLRSNGIAAFYKAGSPNIYGAVVVWVSEADAGRAREFLPAEVDPLPD